jgi:hypothetical protein
VIPGKAGGLCFVSLPRRPVYEPLEGTNLQNQVWGGMDVPFYSHMLTSTRLFGDWLNLMFIWAVITWRLLGDAIRLRRKWYRTTSIAPFVVSDLRGSTVVNSVRTKGAVTATHYLSSRFLVNFLYCHNGYLLWNQHSW